MTPTDGHDERKRIFLLDGHSLAYRAYFALPATLATSTGQVTNAVYGFKSMLIKLMGDEHPDYLAVAFDLGRPTVRLEKYAEYKAGRAETPTDFTSQLGLIDELGTLCSRQRANGGKELRKGRDRAQRGPHFPAELPGLLARSAFHGVGPLRRYTKGPVCKVCVAEQRLKNGRARSCSPDRSAARA